jgi:hypothetical protein
MQQIVKAFFPICNGVKRARAKPGEAQCKLFSRAWPAPMVSSVALIIVSAIWNGRAGSDYPVGCVPRTNVKKSGWCVKRTLRKYSFRQLVAETMIKAEKNYD